MKKLISLFLIIALFAISCRERQRKGAFQGTWYKKGHEIEAFAVRGDSMFFPGLDKGYPYEFRKDTLVITFTERETKSQILSFSSRRLNIWDMSLSHDTISLVRKPGNIIDSLAN